MGQPLEQPLRTCLIGLALGQRLGFGTDDLADVYYVALLRFLGCTADALEFAEMVGGDDIVVRSAIAPVLGNAERIRLRRERLQREQDIIGRPGDGSRRG